MVYLTGGKAAILHKNYFPEAKIVPEFKAVCEGARFLTGRFGEKPNGKYLLVNVGTGTSWYLMNGKQSERVLGSGFGGGTFMGLARQFAGKRKFHEYIDLAAEGDKGKVDLLVKDIYEGEEPPIDGYLTASNFAKAVLSTDHTEADRVASVVNMLAENIVQLSKQTAVIYQTQEVVFIGSTLIGNQPFRKALERYTLMVDLHPRFLSDGEFSGAIGAILST
jgi:type II pantothenate kinase